MEASIKLAASARKLTNQNYTVGMATMHELKTKHTHE